MNLVGKTNLNYRRKKLFTDANLRKQQKQHTQVCLCVTSTYKLLHQVNGVFKSTKAVTSGQGVDNN